MKRLLFVLLFGGLLLFAGCCGTTSQAGPIGERSDSHAVNYGKTVTVAQNLTITLDGIFEKPPTDEGIKTIEITFTVQNNGIEQQVLPGAFYIKDTEGRYFEANYLTCSFLPNPGTRKTATCSFFNIPQSAQMDSIMMRGMYDESYTLLFEIE